MSGPVTYTITYPDNEETTTVTVVNEAEPFPIQVIEHVCNKCSKVYKGIRCLQKHLLICGQPTTATKKKPQKRKSDEDESISPAKVAAIEETKPPENVDLQPEVSEEGESPAIEVLEAVLTDGEDNPNDELCYCCEESLKTAHTGHVKCKFCRKTFHTYMGRDKHTINLHNSSEQFKCSKCKMQCVNAEILEKHMSKHLDFVCVDCGAEFTRRYHLERHTQNSRCGDSAEKRPHACEVCGKTFLRLDNLRVHLRAHMGETPRKRDHLCTICDKSFFGQSMLLIHIRSHTGERPFPCDLCEKAFPSNGALRKHRRVHTGEKPFECSYCHVRFSAKETLNRHVKTHTGNKSYKCDLCGISFIQRTQLKNHMFHHTGQDGVKCPHCDELFDNKSTMNRHISKLHDIKWRCPTCPLTFGTEDDLKSHEEAMHGSHKRFICENCCLEFPKKSQLLEHIAECIGGAQTAQPTLSCLECGKVYKRHDLLDKHLRLQHMSSQLQPPSPQKKKRGRPPKVAAPEPELEFVEVEILEENPQSSNDEIFNQLKSNLDATSFTENCPLRMSSVTFKTERALKKVFEQILKGLLDKAMLKRFGWPKAGVAGTLDQVLKVMGVETAITDGEDDQEEEEEEEEDNRMTKLKNKMMALLGKFIGQEQLESMMNNYTVDQVLNYLADSVAK